MLKLFPTKIIINLKGTNQGVSIKSENEAFQLARVDKYGKKVILPFEEEKGLPSELAKETSSRKLKSILSTLLIFIVSGGLTVHFLTRDILEERLFQKYYSPIKEDLSTYVIQNTAFDQAKLEYIEGDATVAWLLMDGLPKTFSFEKEKTAYQALTLIELKEYEKAIEMFDILLDMPGNKNFIVLAKWYQGLCYLKLYDVPNAKKAFNTIASGNSVYRKKVIRILKKLEKHS